MPKVDLTKEECALLVASMEAGIEQANADIMSSPNTRSVEDIKSTLFARSLFEGIKAKIVRAFIQ